MAYQPLQAQKFSLAGAGAVAGATSIILKTFTMIDGTNIAMSDLGAIAYMTLEPGNSTLEEQISFTGVTQNSNGTATLSGVKTVLMDYPYTETSGLAQTHAGSTTAVLSNTTGHYNQFAIKQNDETISGQWLVPTPLSGTAVANKNYVDTVVGGNPVTTNAVTVAGTAGENIIAGSAVYFKTSDGKWWNTDADATGTTDLIQIGITQSTALANAVIASGVMIRGIDTHQGGLTQGALQYLSNTAGAISSSAGTIERVIGQAASTTSILFDPDFYYIPLATQKAAMAGTSGTPSSTNLFATAASLHFGGNGEDGALSISSGTTTVNLAGASIYIKNYTSISITGTGALAFSNPAASGTLIILKSQGAITLTSSATPMIDARSLGGLGGTGFVGTTGNGLEGSSAISVMGTCVGGPGGRAAVLANAFRGTGFNQFLNAQACIAGKVVPLWAGAGGGGGACSTGSAGGDGGRGAGGLYLECGGTLNFTTASGISVAGANGSDGTGGTNSGGGGGGAAGSCVILYNACTSSAGTITITGGTGGNTTGSAACGAGGGNAFNGGLASINGTGGGNGAVGLSWVALNKDFA